MCVIGFECVCVSVTEKAMAAQSSTLAWKILWTEEKYCITSLICGIQKEMIQLILQSRKRLTDLVKEIMVLRDSYAVLLPGKSHGRRAWWAVVHGVAKSRTRLSDFTFTFHFHTLKKEMATHSSVLSWRIPGTEEPSGLPSMGSHRVRHD